MDVSLSQFEVQFSDNEIIFCEYEKGDCFYFIKSGNVKLTRQVDNQESILDVLNPGVFFGEMAIIEEEPRSASAIADGDTVLLKFSSDNFETVVLKNATLVTKLIRTFVDRIWSQQQRLQVYRFKDNTPRIVAMLLNLKTAKQGNRVAQVNVTIDNLSKWVGVTEQDCKKELQSLVASRYIVVQEKAILLNDIAALERILSIHSHIRENKE